MRLKFVNKILINSNIKNKTTNYKIDIKHINYKKHIKHINYNKIDINKIYSYKYKYGNCYYCII